MSAFDRARWIWNAALASPNVYVNFEDSFTIGGDAGALRLRISCDRNYALYLNGNFVDCGQYGDYEDLKFYDELDVTPYLTSGVNKLLVTVFYQGLDCSNYRHGAAGVIYELCGERGVVCASSEKTVTYKNSAYEDGSGVEWVSGQLGLTFHYDSTKENERLFESKAKIVNKTYNIAPRPIKKLTMSPPAPALLKNRGAFRDTVSTGTPAYKMQYSALEFSDPNSDVALPRENGVLITRSPEQRLDSADGMFAVIDLGTESTGLLTLELEVERECDIFIGWGEHLDDMRVRSYVGGRNFAASYHAHAGRNVFFCPFLRCGLRYVQLAVYAPSFTLYYAGIRPTVYPLGENIGFTCADSLHNRIYEVSKRTLLLCMHEHYEDCPWREQSLYSMDSRNQMLCGYYAFRETRFARASIELMAHSIREDNMLELCSPAVVSITIPSFTAIFLTQLYEYLTFSGDTEFVREMLPYAERIAGEFIRRSQNDMGLIKCFTEAKYWNFYEWQSGLEGSIGGSVDEQNVTYDAPLNAFVSFGLRSLADICKTLGDGEMEKYYRARHLELNAAINRVFYNPENGVYASYMRAGELSHYCELTNSLIVYADAVPDELLGGVLAHLCDNTLIPVTISHSIFKYDALMRDRARYGRFVFSDIARLWGHMLANDATTFWETIDGESAFGNAGSLCHGWSAIPVYIYFKYALNADPSETGLYECKIEE